MLLIVFRLLFGEAAPKPVKDAGEDQGGQHASTYQDAQLRVRVEILQHYCLPNQRFAQFGAGYGLAGSPPLKPRTRRGWEGPPESNYLL